MKTILVVDDEFGIVDALSILLEEEGYQVTSAGNGRHGLEQATSKQPDLIILDVMMPVMSGPEMLRRLRANAATARIPVVIMSAAPASAAIIMAADRGELSAFLRKPFALNDLLRVVHNLIGVGDGRA